MLPSSQRLGKIAFLDVAKILLDNEMENSLSFRCYLFSKPYEPPTCGPSSITDPTKSPTSSTSKLATVKQAAAIMMSEHSSFLELTIKEASGGPGLGIFLMVMVAALNEKVDGWSFRADMEYEVLVNSYQGQNPASDAAVAAIATTRGDKKHTPIILFEYKPSVHSSFTNVDHLMEVLIQSFYCMTYHKVDSILHCLTDLTVWHYFKFKKNDQHLEIEWFRTIIDEWSTDPRSKEAGPNFDVHLDFIVPVVLTQLH